MSDEAEAFNTLRETFMTGLTRSYEWRVGQLTALRQLMQEHEREIKDALREDLGKSAAEALVTEVTPSEREMDDTLKSLREWMEPEAVATLGLLAPGTSYIRREPLGVSLVIGPFNYPYALLIVPLMGAIAGGNCAILKPSELTPHVSQLFADLIPRFLDPDCFRVIQGGIPETSALLKLPFDMLFFTGSDRVGRIVMEAGAKHLSKVILELGGKSPTIVDEHMPDLEVVARRIAWGKWVNAGQTCLAPDYILVHESQHDTLVQALKRKITEFYGENPQASADYGRIVNSMHVNRLQSYLEGDTQTIYCGGEVDVADRYVAPTLLTDVSPDAPVMQNEIFGPLLPIFTYTNLDDAINMINQRPIPLAIYVFSSSQATVDRVMNSTRSGGVCVNDTVVHFANCNLPFGGIGNSGIGSYHGYHSFKAFTHERSVLDKNTTRILDVPVRYPPYTEFGNKLMKSLHKSLPDVPAVTPRKLLKMCVYAAVAVFVAWAIADKKITFHF